VGSQNYVHGKVNHVTLESVQKAQGVMLGMHYQLSTCHCFV
jgi:hypothetical protein